MDNKVPFWLDPDEPGSVAEAPRVLLYSVGPDYFRTMEIPLLRGRSFTPADTVQSEQVTVIDSAMAEAYFPGAGVRGNLRLAGQFRATPHQEIGIPWPWARSNGPFFGW